MQLNPGKPEVSNIMLATIFRIIVYLKRTGYAWPTLTYKGRPPFALCFVKAKQNCETRNMFAFERSRFLPILLGMKADNFPKFQCQKSQTKQLYPRAQRLDDSNSMCAARGAASVSSGPGGAGGHSKPRPSQWQSDTVASPAPAAPGQGPGHLHGGLPVGGTAVLVP